MPDLVKSLRTPSDYQQRSFGQADDLLGRRLLNRLGWKERDVESLLLRN